MFISVKITRKRRSEGVDSDRLNRGQTEQGAGETPRPPLESVRYEPLSALTKILRPRLSPVRRDRGPEKNPGVTGRGSVSVVPRTGSVGRPGTPS